MTRTDKAHHLVLSLDSIQALNSLVPSSLQKDHVEDDDEVVDNDDEKDVSSSQAA